MQSVDAGGVGAAQLEPQEVGEQMVVAKPGAVGVERGDERVFLLELEQDPLESEWPVIASARRPVTRSRIDVRSRSSRTSGGWRSSTSAIRYPATLRSLPEKSRTNRSGSGCPASEIAARRRPAAQPSVRS